MLNSTTDGLTGAVDEPMYHTFPDKGLVIDVVIHNASGDVVVRGNPAESMGDTTVRIEPRLEIRSVNNIEDKLEEIQWDVRMDQNDHGGQTLFITLKSKDHEAWFAGSDIEVDAARLGDVTIDTKRGKIIVDDNRGSVDLSTTRGEIRVRTPWPMTKPSAMVTKDADIEWVIRGESAGAYDCETVGGTIHSYCRYGRWLMLDEGNYVNGKRVNRNDGNSLHATLNNGKNPIVMRNVDGDIRIKIVEDPHSTGTFHWP